MFDSANTPATEATTAPASTQAEEGQGQPVYIPLSKLEFDSDNVRKRGGTNVGELKALIASQGQLQNLTVCPLLAKRGKPTGKFGVVAGGRRLRALRELANEGHIGKDHPVLCIIKPREQAITISAAENSGREPMTGADTLQSFLPMAQQGHGPEALSHSFGISVKTVQGRLKLANISPKLFALYADEQITIDQLMALAVIDDHTRQEAIWDGTNEYHREPQHLRRMALGVAVSAANDRIARFVGLDAYVAAGGQVTRDMFTEDDEAHCDDPALLSKLAADKLESERERLLAEGEAWVDVVDRLDHKTRQDYAEAPTSQRKATKDEQRAIKEARKKLAIAEKAFDDFQEADEEDDEEDGRWDTLQQSVTDAEAEVDALEGALRFVADDVKSLCGVVLVVENDGTLGTHRNLMRKADAKNANASARAESSGRIGDTVQGDGEGQGAQESQETGLSDALQRRLAAQRTVAVQVELARHSHVAMAVLANTLMTDVLLCSNGYLGSNIAGRNRASELKLADPAIESSKAWEQLATMIAAVNASLPDDQYHLLSWLIEQPLDTLVQILALCTALTVYNGAASVRHGSGHLIPQAIDLNMADYWSATGDTYFKSVPKALIAEAIATVDPEAAKTVDKLKKGEAVALAEAKLKDSRWLPAVLQTASEQ